MKKPFRIVEDSDQLGYWCEPIEDEASAEEGHLTADLQRQMQGNASTRAIMLVVHLLDRFKAWRNGE